AVEGAIRIPLINVADVTAQAVLAAGHRRAALLGTRFTMEEPFYRDRLAASGLQVTVPTPAEQDAIHRIIFEELVRGKFRQESRERFLAIMRRMQRDGSEAVILGCTEFGLLIRPEDAPEIPRFDTAELHCRAAVDWMLAPG
ncbi:MAG: aspartate/glutamate racemase family protein, partial [Rhodanobacteraceae bacterium]